MLKENKSHGRESNPHLRFTKPPLRLLSFGGEGDVESRQRELNLQPAVYKTAALPVEL